MEDIREQVLTMVEDNYVDKDLLLVSLLKYMSHADIRDCLKANEISLLSQEDFNE